MELGIPELVGRAGGEEQAQSVGIVKEIHEPQRQFSCSSKPTQSLVAIQPPPWSVSGFMWPVGRSVGVSA